jgi:hypothetical protein
MCFLIHGGAHAAAPLLERSAQQVSGKNGANAMRA